MSDSEVSDDYYAAGLAQMISELPVPPPVPPEAQLAAELAPLGDPAPVPLGYRGTRYVLNVAQEIAAVSSRLMLAEVVANGTIDLAAAMRAEGLADLKVISATRTDKGIEIVIEGKRS